MPSARQRREAGGFAGAVGALTPRPSPVRGRGEKQCGDGSSWITVEARERAGGDAGPLRSITEEMPT